MIHLEARSKNYDFSKEESRNGVVDNTYKSTKLLHHGINDYGLKVSITAFRS